MARKRLGELLVMAGAIDEFQLQSALGEQRRWGRPLGVTLVELGLIEEDTLVKILSTQLNIPAIDLGRVSFEPAALKLLDYDLCSQYQVIPFRYDESGKFLYLAMADPTNIEVFDRIRVQTQCNPRPHLGGPKSIENAIRRKYLGESAIDRPWTHHREEVILDAAGGIQLDSQPAGAGSARAGRPPSSSTRPVGDGPAARRAPGPTDPVRRIPDTARFDEHLMKDVLRELKEVKAMLTRDEMVLRKLMSLIVQKGLCTRDELVSRLHED